METRRVFLKKSTSLSLGTLLSGWAIGALGYDKYGEILPLRTITRDGEKTTAFALGGFHVSQSLNPSIAKKLVERSMELGVRFYDTARGYQKGVSEEYYGKYLTPKYRDDIFLMTKSPAQTKEVALQHLNESLRALKTERVDLWQMHNVRSIADVDQRISEGVLDFFLEAKAKGKTRYIGFTVHANPKVGIYFLDQLQKRGIELDTCQMPVNVCDASYLSFQKELLPLLLEKKYGVIAMKTMAGGGIIGRRFNLTSEKIANKDIPNVVKKAGISFEKLHQYVYSMPVSALCSGCETIDELEKNINVLKSLKKLSEKEMEAIAKMARPFAGELGEHYKRIL